MNIKGIDVSKHQGRINWAKVKADGINFALIRVGYTWYNGGLTIDEKFKYNVEQATKNGINIGVYVYSYDKSVNAAKIGATKVLDTIKPYSFKYPVIFDIEYENFNKTIGKGKINTDIVCTYLEAFEKAGYYAMVYASTDFFNNYLELDRLDKYDKWVAQYNDKCTFKRPFGIWQYSNKGKVNGIMGDVDLNISYKDYHKIIQGAELNKLKSKPIAPTKNYTEYVVKKGDSFWKIAHNKMGSGLKMWELAKYNGLKITSTIYPEQKIRIPK